MKILVIDDEPDICEVITITFNLRWPDAQVLTASTAERGLELAKREMPDITILDLGLPDSTGFDLCREVRQATGAPVLVLTAKGSASDKVKGLEAGADDYMTKPFDHMELLSRVRAILRRRLSPDVSASEPPYEQGPLYIDFGKKQVWVGGSEVRLTPLEYGLLYHLVKNANRVVPHKTLLAKVWGREYVEQLDQLKLHVDALRAKLGDDPQHPRMVLSERGVGYRFVEPD